VHSPEVFGRVSFIVVFPLTFLSNAFVPSEKLPTPLRIVAEFNPVSALALAARKLFGNVPSQATVPGSWPLQHPVETVLVGIAILLAVFVPLAILRFGRVSSR
jgi:ABC-2 type transport system permease protein